MLYHVFSNSGPWDSDMLGLVETIDTPENNIHTALGVLAEKCWNEEYSKRGECPLHSARSVNGTCEAVFEQYELSAFFKEQEIAGIVVDDGTVALILMLVPATVTVI